MLVLILSVNKSSIVLGWEKNICQWFLLTNTALLNGGAEEGVTRCKCISYYCVKKEGPFTNHCVDILTMTQDAVKSRFS